MKSSKSERLEELIAGLTSNTLTIEESEELSLLCNDFEDIEEIKASYDSLINTIQLIPAEKASKKLYKKITKTCQISSSMESKIEFPNLIKLILIAFSGILFIQLNNYNTKYAFNNNDKSITANSNKVIKNKNVFNLKPVLRNSNNSNYMNASVIIRPNQATNLLNVQGLPQLGSGTTYRLWAHTEMGSQGCVSFLPDKYGNVRMNIPSQPTKSAKSITITIDKVIRGYGPEEPGEAVLTSIKSFNN